MKQYVIRRQRKKSEIWQVIYMDLMTLVMVFFVILWSLNQGKDEGVTDTFGDQTTRLVNLPSDILFPTGKAELTPEGEDVFAQLFEDDTGTVLSFDTGGLTRRLLVIHGHTDAVGDKDRNFRLGFRRAYAAYKEIETYGDEVSDNVILCTHADNSPAEEVPQFEGEITEAHKDALDVARALNRRITIEDKIVSTLEEE